ncbi:hypothetical protein KFE25_012731 [Diacronema lutheri]|uniref:Rubisco LSMT substrate-binding domain-containing protein n=2 Tax=Diacronema lutheri TaxID=2081491 RepID=A0A8J5X4G4_DIALT|nr:hypothetical protein KFE25_012731 [Diacronema lutheri]
MARAVFALALALAPGAWGVAAGRAPGRVLHRSRGAVRMADGALVDWLRASGATVSGVAQQRDGLLELQRDARPGEELVSVPDALHLSEASLRANVVGSFLDGWPMAAGEHAPLALALLHESFLADASPWAGYIRALPPAGEGSLDVPLLWSDAEQAELSASTTLPVRALLAELAADYAWLSAGPFAQAPDLFPPHVYSPQRYAWAHAVALSRAVRLDGKLVLAPGVGDVARSGSARGASASAERRQPSAGGFSFFGGGGGAAKPGAAVLVAREGARPGAPLALEADLSPAECLWAHGRLPVGRSGECELRLVVPPSDRLLADKAEVLSQAGLSTSQLWTLRSGALEREELLKYLRLVALRGGDAFILEPVFAADLWPQHLAAPFSRLNEDEACGLGIELCTAAVTAMCGDAQADAAAAAASDGSRSARMAALRVGERAALLDSMRWLEEERALNGGKEYYQERRLRELNLNRPISDDEIVPA